MSNAGKADELRRAFDASFAAPQALETAARERFLAVGLAGDRYALRIKEIAGLVAARKVVPVPSAIPELLGLAGIRGELVPVYGLAALLGYEPSGEPPRWFVLSGGTEPVGLALSEFAGYLEARNEDVHRESNQEVLRAGGEARRIISMPLLVETIKERIGAIKER